MSCPAVISMVMLYSQPAVAGPWHRLRLHLHGKTLLPSNPFGWYFEWVLKIAFTIRLRKAGPDETAMAAWDTCLFGICIWCSKLHFDVCSYSYPFCGLLKREKFPTFGSNQPVLGSFFKVKSFLGCLPASEPQDTDLQCHPRDTTGSCPCVVFFL